ncbi:hypothetical protein F7725_022766 [Dissostichus mawsoni]|uniref:SH3 domain-containing protein n=1 Tax=Dissostichus mawsoni TaxID=36200 RepID=A0A7J5Z0T0_DISMA|nr:hypothetical protein F7725_022766 [Dissostichus mawsoni]
MADRADMFSLSTFHSLSPPGCRPSHDISLEEFDDEDLSEITDDCGIGLNYDSDPYEKDSLNNNSSLSPKKGSWQDSLRKTSQGRLSPTHTCLEDGVPVTGQCPASPVTQAPGSQTKGIPKNRLGRAGTPNPLTGPSSATWRATGGRGPNTSHPSSGDLTEQKADPLIQKTRVPSVDEQSQCSDTEVDHDLNSDHNHKHSNRRATDTYTITSESGLEPENDLDLDGTSRCLSSTAPIGVNDGADTPLSDEELEKDYDVEFMCKETYDMVCKESRCSYVEFPSIEPTSFSSYVSTSRSDAGVTAMEAAGNDSTSPSSDPGIADMNQQGYMTSDQDKDLSSPGSDSDIEGELEAAFTCGTVVSNMISSISETELDLTSDESSSGRSSHLTNSIEEASSPTSDQELDLETELEQDSDIVGLKTSLLLGQPDPIKEGSILPSPSPLPSPYPLDSPILPPEPYEEEPLQNMDDELSFEHQADPDETLPPAQQCEDSLSRQMVLQIEPDHSLESFKRSFYLPVGPRLMPNADEYDGTSEGESDSESEDELSENSDSPWLLCNLVNRMISEGSYPISCPEDCFKRKLSVSDTISPSSDIGEGDGFNDEDQEKKVEMDELDEEEKEAKGYDMMEPGERRKSVEGCEHNGRGTTDLNTLYTTQDSEKNFTDKPSKNTRRQEEDQEPNNDLMMHEGRKELDSPSLSESVVSDKDEGRETEPRPTRASASLERITEVKHSLTLDIPTAQTNRCFSLSYSTENEEEEDDGDTYPLMGDMRKQSYRGSDLELDSSPPIDSSVQNHPLSDRDLPLCETNLSLRQSNEEDELAYDSMKYTLVVDENTTLELVKLRRCTSVLSDESELSTLCDEDHVETGQVSYGRDNEKVRPELLSSSEDSSPEADLPFSKKFLNVFVNSTSRSSSTESFGLFSCTINGEERDQTHRAVYRFIPRHADELELDVDDPLYVEEEEDDYWYRGYNMRTGERGIFPAFYAHEVIGQSKEVLVEVPYHQGNGILCAAMQKIAISRKRTVHVRPPSLCELEISLQGVKLIMSLEDEYDALDELLWLHN